MSDNKGLLGYPRESDTLLASWTLFPKLDPPLSNDEIREAIKTAFERSWKTKKGELAKQPDTPDKFVKVCLNHLRNRTDLILGASFYSKVVASEVFELDAIPHEMQRYRMKFGNFYQYLLVELMKKVARRPDPPIINAMDGEREGDVKADIRPPIFDRGLRLYISVKKSSDTIGGQNVDGVMSKLGAPLP